LSVTSTISHAEERPLAQKIQVLLTCDLDDDDTPAVETVTFAYQGNTYAFELCEAHLEEFNAMMAGWISSARRSDGSSRSRRAAATSAASPGRRRRAGGRNELSDIRAWARQQGYQVSDRGRISQEIRTAWENDERSGGRRR
jgi:hypothetical protein